MNATRKNNASKILAAAVALALVIGIALGGSAARTSRRIDSADIVADTTEG